MSSHHHVKSVLVASALLAAAGPLAQASARPATACVSAAAAEHAEAAIRAALASYNAALNGGNTAAVLPLYTDNGIFMAPYSPSAIGKAAIRNAYDNVFRQLKFNVKFHIAELVVMAPDWAFVRTNSAGTTLHQSTGKTLAEANQELFIFHRADSGKWRIARYSFSPIQPPNGM